MTFEPERARSLSALLALYCAFCSLYALDPYVLNSSVAAAMFALLGLWFALAAAFHALADADAQCLTLAWR